MKRWFYIAIEKALRADIEREEAIFALPEDRKLKEDFDRKTVLDLSTPETEYKNLMFPVNQVFDWDAWQDGFGDYWVDKGEVAQRQVFQRFKNEVLQHFKSYQVPVIALGPDTSHEAVCLVFEKVNTGGKPLDAFELVTAMYSAKGYRLRDDWMGAPGSPGQHARLQTFGHMAGQNHGVLEKIASTDFLQAVALRNGSGTFLRPSVAIRWQSAEKTARQYPPVWRAVRLFQWKQEVGGGDGIRTHDTGLTV